MPSPESQSELTPPAELFAEFLSRREQGQSLDFESFVAAHPEHADELRRLEQHWQIVDSALRAAPEDGAASADGSASANHERYELGEEVARGGMGVVLQGFDRFLQRKVAIKFGKAPAGDARALSRFLDEARITGQLEHPGIVPIYDLGMNDARHFYFTMPLLPGRTFREIIDLVHQGDSEWTLPRALGVLLAVCDAVASAHSKGVIHRDLKPSNVIVGRFGETYVVDWGLARVLSEADRKDIRLRDVVVASSAVHASRRDLAADDPESPLLTMDGDVVGTPAYMPPEQARGEVHRIGPRADVYAAGAMLYHVLAGEMPYAQKGVRVSARAVLARVLAGPPRPLPELTRAAPPELVAICAKAMAREPEERYADMYQLAADLRAFLELRVVRAYGGGAWTELRKWVRRNRLAATACVAGVLALSVGLVVTSMFKREASLQATRASDNFAAAMDAVDGMVLRVGETALHEVPGAERVRRELLQQARGLYARILAQHGDRPELRARVARTHHGLGRLHKALGENDEAVHQSMLAIACYDEVLEERSDADAHYRRVASWQVIARLQSERARWADAEATIARVRELLGAALALHPGHHDMLVMQIDVEHDLAFLLHATGRSEQAVVHERQAVQHARAFVERSGGSREARAKLAAVQQLLGSMLCESKRLPEAVEPLQQAVAAYEQLILEAPRDTDVRSGLAFALTQMDVVHRANQDADASRAALARALELLRELAAEFPRRPQFHSMTASVLSNRATLLQNTGQAAEALADLEEAIRLQKIAVARVPDNKDYRQRLRNHLVNRLWSLKLLGRHAEIAELADEIAELEPESADDLQYSGAFLLMSAALASQDESLEAGEREKVVDERLQRGVTWLRAAMAKGFHAWQRFREAQFSPLRKHAAFRELLADMRAAAEKEGKEKR